MRRLMLILDATMLVFGAGLVASGSVLASPAAPSVTLSSSVNPSTYGQKIVLTATVTHPGQATSQITGTMVFLDEEALLGTAEVRKGKATLSNDAVDAGSDPLTAIFTPTGGGAQVSSEPLPLIVNRANPTITLLSSRPSAEYGQNGKITATVKSVASAPQQPTGTVEYLIEGSWFWTVPVSTQGRATLSLAEIYPSFSPGTYLITAGYSGDENYNEATTASALAQTLIGITSEPVSTISLNEKGQPVFSPNSFKLSSANPVVGCNVTITNNTAEGFALLYGTPGNWKRLPGGGIGAGASRGVGVGLEHFTGYFTVIGATNYVSIKCV